MKLLFKLSFVLLAPAVISFAQQNPPEAPAYKTGYSSIMKLGKDLYSALSAERREQISTQPISIETDVMPFVHPLYYADGAKAIRGVWISAGFIDLVNNLAHARAIDRIEKNYFNDYVEILATETGVQPLRPLSNIQNPRYWTDEMLNEQKSDFNSIVGMLVGINLAHHYLGHFEKYKDKLTGEGGKPVSINTLLSRREWERAFVMGCRNAISAGCMIEGAVPFFEAFDKMKKRPAWAIYFLPEDARFGKLRREMEGLQRRHLQGDE